MEVPQQHRKIREGRQTDRQFPEPDPSVAAPLPGRRATARGCDVEPGPCPKATYKAKGLKGQYVADFFAGVGGVAKAARALGYAAKEWEIGRGSQFDLTKSSVLQKIRSDAQKFLVLGAMLAPPCSSFSVARDRTAVLRTKEFPWGLPKHMLSPLDQLQVDAGNRCFRSAIRIIHWLDTQSIPWILENPATSKCWFLPPLQKLEHSPHVMPVITDFCQYDTCWRKRTKLLRGNLDCQDVDRLHRVCTGRGLCSRTQKPHFQLTGSNHQGIPWTTMAQSYPKGLCRDLAFFLTCPTHYL